MTTSTPCISYARVSVGVPNALAQQGTTITQYIEAHGLAVQHEFKEVASAVGARPVYDEMLAYLAEHPGTRVVVSSLDRLFRTNEDRAAIEKLAQTCGVVVCVAG